MIGMIEEEMEIAEDRIHKIEVKWSEEQIAGDFAIVVLRHYRMAMDDTGLKARRFELHVSEVTVRAGVDRQTVTSAYQEEMYMRTIAAWTGNSVGLTEPVRPQQGDLRNKTCTLHRNN